MLLALPVFALQAWAGQTLPQPVPTLAQFNVINDEGGADDQPGQKDLNLQGVYTPSPTDLWVLWQWNVTSLSGGNTGDACALFDTGTDGKVNTAVCVTIEKKPAVQAVVSPRVYNCGNGKVDRCTSTITPVATVQTNCATNTNANDPFHLTGATSKDTQAICKIELADVAGGGTPKLVNTCSYPSQTPTSDPSDCVLVPRDAFLTINKTATPNNTGQQFTFTTDAIGQFDCTITNSGSCGPTPIPSDKTFQVSEVVPANWAIVGTPSCTNSTTTQSFSGSTISNLKAASETTVTCSFTDERKTGAIKVIKQHSGTTDRLGGAVFSIGSFTGQTTAGSGADLGTVCKDGLPLGASYDVTETSPPNGYASADPATQSVSLNTAGTCASGATVVTFNNPVVKGTINIHKEDGDGEDLPGATFTLYVNNAPLAGPRGTAAEDPITAFTCTTNGDGDCSIGQVPLGDYWVVETGVPNGYIKAADRAVNVALGTQPGQGDTDNLTFVDPAAAGTIVINKKRSNGGGSLPGATFTLYVNNLPLAGPRGLNDTATSTTCTSNASGVCTMTDVLPGDYWLVETTTPAGYDTAPDTAVTMPLGSQAGTGATVELDITDPVVPGTVNIHKTGINGTALSGATFTLYVDNPTVGGTRTAADTITTKTCTTAAGTGDCSITGVAPGNYWVVETTTPNGYDTAPEQTVVVGTGAAAHVGDVDNLTFADPVVNGRVTITKTDDADNPLNGATFTLYVDNPTVGGTRTAADTITTKTCTTSGNGTCEITDVVPGNYWVVETSTPAHYVTAADQTVVVGIGGAPHVGDLDAKTFVNVRKDRVIVLVCHEGTNTLNSRDVTVNGDKKQSLSGASLTTAEEQELCELGGASYGDIGGKPDVNALIELSKNSAP